MPVLQHIQPNVSQKGLCDILLVMVEIEKVPVQILYGELP
jgi:hypothetical protein